MEVEKRRISWLAATAMVAWLAVRPGLAESPRAELVEVRAIWDRAPHNAFTDLVYWNGRFVCAFREGRGHVSADGRIRVLVSPEGDGWQSASLVELEGYDLRDSALSVTPDNRLMLLGGAAPRPADDQHAPTGTFVSFSRDAARWTKPKMVVEPGRWLWRVTWQGGQAYGISYPAGTSDRSTQFMVSNDGMTFRAAEPNLLDQGRPTEAVLRFTSDKTVYCLQRRDGEPPANTALLGISHPPYDRWQWHDLGMHFGGPNFIQIPSLKWIAAGRIHGPTGAKTVLASLDVERNRLTTILELPSGGDTSYPGLVWHNGLLWVSYYSSHEGNAKIYLARVKVE